MRPISPPFRPPGWGGAYNGSKVRQQQEATCFQGRTPLSTPKRLAAGDVAQIRTGAGERALTETHSDPPPPPPPPPPKVRCVASHDQRAGAQPLFCTPGAVVEEDQNPGDKTLQHRVITTTRSVQPGTSYAPFSEFPSAAKDGIPWTML